MQDGDPGACLQGMLQVMRAKQQGPPPHARAEEQLGPQARWVQQRSRGHAEESGRPLQTHKADPLRTPM